MACCFELMQTYLFYKQHNEIYIKQILEPVVWKYKCNSWNLKTFTC